MCITAIINRKPGQTQLLFNIFETLDLEPYKKSILQDRYLTVLRNFQYRANLYSCLFFMSRITITVGSILVPAFLSIQGNPIRDNLYLAAWVISILVTVCNGVITLFKIDKKYYFIHMTLELLHSEGWQYVGLCGRYNPKDAPIPPTHDNKFIVFSYTIEKIKMRQVEEEYWKFVDSTGTANEKSRHPNELIQTPVTQQGALSLLPAEQKGMIEGWLGAMSRNSVNGLMPRKGINSSLRVDGASNPKVYRPPADISVSVQSELPSTPSTRDAVVPTPFTPNTIYEDTLNEDSSE